jgi:hypothetical protein
MVHLTRKNRTVWHGASDDPQELAAADAFFRGSKADPEKFSKGPDGRFFFEAEVPVFETVPWDEITLDGFGKTVRLP